MAWEPAKAGGLGLKEAQMLRTSQSLRKETGVSPSTVLLLSEVCDSHLPETHLHLSMNLGPVPSLSREAEVPKLRNETKTPASSYKARTPATAAGSSELKGKALKILHLLVENEETGR